MLVLNLKFNDANEKYTYDEIYSQYKGIIPSSVERVEGVARGSRALRFAGTEGVLITQDWKEERYWNNPVVPTPFGKDSEYCPNGIYDPSILFVGEEIWIYFAAVGGDGHIREGLAISKDGVNFKHYGMVLDVAEEGEWDDWKAHDVDVLYSENDGLYRMWYNGNLLPDNPGKIGLATSTDGKVWTKYGTGPVFDVGVPGSWDDTGVQYPSVLEEDGIFYMWYGGYDTVLNGMGLATSPDGITWTRAQATPVLEITNHMGYVVTKKNGVYYVMFFPYNDPYNIYSGYSYDRINWTVNWHPVIQLGVSGMWDDALVAQNDFYFEGSTAYIYYTGSRLKSVLDQIGLIKVENFEEKVQKVDVLDRYPITLSCWLKTTQADAGGILFKGADAEGEVLNFYISDGRLKAYYYIDTNNKVLMSGEGDDGGVINDGLWHHVMFTLDAGGGELFVDGISKNTLAWIGTPAAINPNPQHLLNLGKCDLGYLTGDIDDVRIYSHALSSDECLSLYIDTLHGKDIPRGGSGGEGRRRRR